MDAYQTFQKALLLLDRGQVERGLDHLGQAVQKAEEESDAVTLGSALCAQGDLLFQLGRQEEARSSLERVVAMERADDVLDYEVGLARELIAQLDAE